MNIVIPSQKGKLQFEQTVWIVAWLQLSAEILIEMWIVRLPMWDAVLAHVI